MKAISLWQPWATLVALQAKMFETRSWPTRYRGPIAIHAARRFQRPEQEICFTRPFADVLARNGYMPPNTLPFGCIVATAYLVDCQPTQYSLPFIGPAEEAFGDWSRGRYAWQLMNIRRLAQPLAVTGHQGLWTLPDELLAGVKYV